MNFLEALKEYHKGKKIRRAHSFWDGHAFQKRIEVRNNMFQLEMCCSDECKWHKIFAPTWEDVLADDWVAE